MGARRRIAEKAAAQALRSASRLRLLDQDRFKRAAKPGW
jgi:hypothetical protein